MTMTRTTATRRELMVAHWNWVDCARHARHDRAFSAKCLRLAADCRRLIASTPR